MISDLNCDLGEDEPWKVTRELLESVTSINLACGGHAGDLRSIYQIVEHCESSTVMIGAHPGLADRENKGRTDREISPDEFELLLLQQVGTVERIASTFQIPLHHIKLHGALYHATEAHLELRKRYISCVQKYWPRAIIYGLAGGRVQLDARIAGLAVWGEAFADRVYRSDGTLKPRSESGAVIGEFSAAFKQAGQLIEAAGVSNETGEWIGVEAQTLCIHSDSPNAVKLAREIRKKFLDCR